MCDGRAVLLKVSNLVCFTLSELEAGELDIACTTRVHVHVRVQYMRCRYGDVVTSAVGDHRSGHKCGGRRIRHPKAGLW